ncbi:MAG: flagellar basal body-associated FliL family protein [Gemmobacter sp.]
MRRILPVVLILGGLAGGVGTGLALRPSPEGGAAETGASSGSRPEGEFVRVGNQFVIPLVEDGRVASLIILTLSIEVLAGTTEAALVREPKLRDAFLRVMFDHANARGFAGNFTDGHRLEGLRTALREAARQILGPNALDVLILDIVRQDN